MGDLDKMSTDQIKVILRGQEEKIRDLQEKIKKPVETEEIETPAEDITDDDLFKDYFKGD